MSGGSVSTLRESGGRSWRCVTIALRIGRLARLATAALISASALCLASAAAEAHHYPHYSALRAHGASTTRTIRAMRAPRTPRRSAHYAHRAYPRYAVVAAGGVPTSPAFSAIVVDANSGKTLYSADENGLRHPASITKVMTLYLLFEKLDSGAMTLRTPIPISEHAAGARALETRPRSRRHDQRRRRDQGRRDPLGQRHRGRDRRGGRPVGKQFRRHDDAQGACARHDEHALPSTRRDFPTTSR